MVEEQDTTVEEAMKQIPADLFALQILPHLPGRHLRRLKTVCKDWVHIITSPSFINLHLSKANPRSTRFRVLTATPSAIVEHTNYYHKTTHIPYPPLFSGSSTIIAGSSSDGLICLLNKLSQVALLNPSTGESHSVPLPLLAEAYSVSFWWFGREPSSREYTLVLGISTRRAFQFGVYKFTRTRMKRMHSRSVNHAPVICTQLRSGAQVDGVVYWPIYSQAGGIIFAYHLERNVVSEVEPPSPAGHLRFELGVAGGCLIAIFKNRGRDVFEVWVMKEEQWIKHGDIVEGVDDNFPSLSPIGVFANGDLVLESGDCKSKLMKYNFSVNKPLQLLMECDEGSTNEIIMCADTLVSPYIYNIAEV